MQTNELRDLVHQISIQKAESSTIELKAAKKGCPEKLYGTLSSFSNQDDGGIIIFGVDESADYEICGVYDAQDLQKHVVEQCNQMNPKIRAWFTVCTIGDKQVVSAEIPSLSLADRPCFYAGAGRYKGSYVRVGDADEPMTEYEIYSYEAFRRKYEDETAIVKDAEIDDFDMDKADRYRRAFARDKPNFKHIENLQALDFMGMVKKGKPTVAGMLLLGKFPQSFFPQLGIIATTLPGTQVGEISASGERFIDNERIEGTLDEQVEEAVNFVRKNTRTSITITSEGQRIDTPQYPMDAFRELILNALIHRDYSIHTQGMPIQLQLFRNRLVVTNPGGLYGYMTLNKLGRVQPDTRNPRIANAMEIIGLTENRYSGIPAVRHLMERANLPAPKFEDKREEFCVTLYSRNPLDDVEVRMGVPAAGVTGTARGKRGRDIRVLRGQRVPEILAFCSSPRTGAEISELLGLGVAYTKRVYINPLVAEGRLALGVPGRPRSHKQTYRTVE
ncbi:MAG: putative DNA binding domain-containing protein [Bifidobacterium sp.]|nr:putative DNA binding domain-containing protein [Bifidobacterium sp.]